MRGHQRLGAISAAILVAAMSCGVLAQDNWPQWRGPDQNGVSTNTDLPLEWTSDRNIVWRTELPFWAGGTPVIWGDRIFLTSPSAVDAEEVQKREEELKKDRRRFGYAKHPGGQDLMLLCLSKTDGRVLWERTVARGNAMYMKSNNSSSSPVTDGKHVWTVTGTGVVAAYDMNGGLGWKRDLQEMYGTLGLNWGYASSPLLHDGKLIVEVLHGYRTDDPSYLVAFDAETGEVAWRVERETDAPMESPDAYTTPIAVEHNGKTHIVVSGGDYVTGHDPETGKELWRAGGLNPRKAPNYRIVASPVAANGMIFAPTRVRPLLALRAGGVGDVTESHLVWKWDQSGSPDVPTPACDGERFYMVNDAGMVTCVNAKTGDAIWGPERTVRGTVSSSPLLAPGRLYFTTEEGVTVVVATDTFKVLATNELDGSYTLSSPVPSGNQLFVRTGSHLYCIGNQPG